MKPKLPPRISAAVNQISVATWNGMVDCLAYAMTHPRGDGSSILNRPGDLLTARPFSGGSGGNGIMGLFRVTLNEENQLVVGRGFVNRNGLEVLEYPGGTLSPRTGYLCICSEPSDKKGNWTEVAAMIKDAPNQCAYPVAKITFDEENQTVSVEQYPVVIAQIVYSGRCPIAEL